MKGSIWYRVEMRESYRDLLNLKPWVMKMGFLEANAAKRDLPSRETGTWSPSQNAVPIILCKSHQEEPS